MRTVARLAVSLVVLALASGPATASAAEKSQSIPNATVKSVSGSSLTVTAAGKDTTFTVEPLAREMTKLGTSMKPSCATPLSTF